MTSSFQDEPETLACPSQESPGGAQTLQDGMPLGPWRIGRLVGRGGMGEVYEAHRADGAFELRVAVKLLKRGLDTDAVVARFARERRILAQLVHPNIAHVLDAGAAPDGRPFLVMEYVDGQPISTYVEAERLEAAGMLRLFVTVCRAVQAAHAQRIVHRDLKPSNVLVTADGQVKLLDFGIAKALAEEDADATRLAGDESALTPAYAAPEQLLGLPPTPATDVYALGVILYQLLTGRLPHERSGRTAEIVRKLDRETLIRPSAVLRHERGRWTDRERLARLKAAGADLDLIVLKALHAEPARRYATAGELGDDLENLLASRPVQARPDSAAYRAGRFVRRNRLAVGAAAAVVGALSIGLVAALWQAHVAVLARNEATQRRAQADDLINFMLGDLQDRLRQVGRLDVLDATLAKAQHYVGSGDAGGLDATALAERVSVLTRVAEVQQARGLVKEAEANAGGAVDTARTLQRLQPGAGSDALLAGAMWRLADAALAAGDEQKGAALLREGVGLAQQALAAQPADPGLILLLARYEASLGGRDDFGPHRNLAEGDAHWRACIERLRPLADRPGVSPLAVEQLVRCESSRLTNLFQDDRWDEARQAAAAFATEAEAMHRQYAGVAFLQYDLFDGLGPAAAELQRLGEPDAAGRASALALQIGRELTALEPGNMEWLRAYAAAVLFDLNIRVDRKAWKEAQADADLGLPLFRQVLEHFPDAGTRLYALQFYSKRGDMYFKQARKDQALAEAATGLSLVPADDQSTTMLEDGKLPLLARRWYYAMGAQPDVARQAQQATEQLLALLATRPEARQVRYYGLLADYLAGRCAEGDRLREALQAEHYPDMNRFQRYRDAGCGAARSVQVNGSALVH